MTLFHQIQSGGHKQAYLRELLTDTILELYNNEVVKIFVL